jgi:hypothetical protein
MVLETAPTAALVVAQAEFLLELPIVALDQPALLGQMHEVGDRGLLGQGRQPKLGRFRGVVRPPHQQPVFVSGLAAAGVALLAAAGVALGRAHAYGGKARGESPRPRPRHRTERHISSGSRAAKVRSWTTSALSPHRRSRVAHLPRPDQAGTSGFVPGGQATMLPRTPTT